MIRVGTVTLVTIVGLLVTAWVVPADAGTIESVTYTDSRSYVGPDFDNPDGILYGVHFLPRFDTHLGQLLSATVTVKLLSAGYSTVKVDNESPQEDGQWLYAGGYLWGNMPFADEMTGWTPSYTTAILSGAGTGDLRVLDADNDGAPDFVGSDAASKSGSCFSPLTESITTMPMPGWPDSNNTNPAFVDFIGVDGGPMELPHTRFSVASAHTTPIHPNIERLFISSNVSTEASVRYVYEVPEPMTAVLLAVGGLAVARRRR